MKLCDLNTSKALRELGYDGEYTYCHVGVYPKNEYQIMTLTDCEKYRHDIIILCAAPRLDDVAYFLRDKHRISIEPMYSSVLHGWDFTAYDMDYDGVDQLYEVYGDGYEDTLEAAVAKAIEIINSRNKSERESDENKRNR